ncbi:MAG: ATP-binding protein, partial [Planctomycetales bacterium]|nr:ATP-binding protein [Planctomycetales bacterium]
QAALKNAPDPPAGEDSQCVELPRVEVATAYLPEQNRLVVTVCDNGVGIPIDQQQRIFNAFVSSKGQRGTGLGLPVSQKIMEEHGGQIKLESETGKGSCFTLELPAIPAREATTANFAEP